MDRIKVGDTVKVTSMRHVYGDVLSITTRGDVVTAEIATGGNVLAYSVDGLQRLTVHIDDLPKPGWFARVLALVLAFGAAFLTSVQLGPRSTSMLGALLIGTVFGAVNGWSVSFARHARQASQSRTEVSS